MVRAVRDEFLGIAWRIGLKVAAGLLVSLNIYILS